MGTICAAAYANIFMANFELKYIYPYIKDKTKMFLRSINDLFMIWAGSEQELLDFLSDLNKKHPSIKFEFKNSQTKIEFLDVLVYKDKIICYKQQYIVNNRIGKITLMSDQSSQNC